jgi:hypothetical protein
MPGCSGEWNGCRLRLGQERSKLARHRISRNAFRVLRSGGASTSIDCGQTGRKGTCRQRIYRKAVKALPSTTHPDGLPALSLHLSRVPARLLGRRSGAADSRSFSETRGLNGILQAMAHTAQGSVSEHSGSSLLSFGETVTRPLDSYKNSYNRRLCHTNNRYKFK